MSGTKLFTLPLLKIEKIGKELYSFYFEKKDLIFLPGQYIQMTIPHKSVDDRGSSRYFTISSSPTEKEYIFITTRKGESSFKRSLFELETETDVQFFGPIGKFVLPVD